MAAYGWNNNWWNDYLVVGRSKIDPADIEYPADKKIRLRIHSDATANPAALKQEYNSEYGFYALHAIAFLANDPLLNQMIKIDRLEKYKPIFIKHFSTQEIADQLQIKDKARVPTWPNGRTPSDIGGSIFDKWIQDVKEKIALKEKVAAESKQSEHKKEEAAPAKKPSTENSPSTPAAQPLQASPAPADQPAVTPVARP